MLRILDVNFNRCREGLRVVEELLRFYFESPLFEKVKNIRHQLKDVEKNFAKSIILARDSQSDLGRKSFSVENERENYKSVLSANFKRVQESLRALEEYLKLDNLNYSVLCKELRYQVYDLEKEVEVFLCKNFALTLYLVTDSRQNSLSLAKVVEEAILGGVTIVQLREKHLSDKEIVEKGKKVKEVCKKHSIPFIIDDRADICKILDADGVHIGQNDISVQDLRELLGVEKIIGKSTHSIKQVKEALKEDVDYIAFGPLYKTPTKDYMPVGLHLIDEVSALAKKALKPVVFIGGIGKDTILEVVENKATAVALVRDIMASKEPRLAAEYLRKKLKGKAE